jgi:hypothetical protein
MVAYVHCGACRRAYDATAGGCPRCVGPVAAAASVELLLEALAAATEEQRERVRAALGPPPTLARRPPPSQEATDRGPAPLVIAHGLRRLASAPARVLAWREVAASVVDRLARRVRAAFA